MSKSVTGYYKTKKKDAWTTKPLVEGEGKTLVVRPLKKTLF